MFEILKLLFFLIAICSSAFILLNQLAKIKSLIILIPFSITFGIASFVFLCHILSYITGPKLASVISICILIFLAILTIILNKRVAEPIEKELSKKQFFITYLFAIFIILLTFLATSKFGTFDRQFHMPVSMTIFHNNVYPPRDPFRSDYVLLYHFGGDLLAGAIHYLTSFDISTSFESIATILSGTTFLSFFALAWLLTKSFKLSFIAGFSTYFGGGLLWLDAIIRFFTKSLPAEWANWGFFQTFLNLGIHGGINNAPSVLTFISTFNLGNPLLVFSLILFWKMMEESDLKICASYIIFLSVSLFTLYLTADWLYVTFFAGAVPFLLALFFKKKKQQAISASMVFLISFILSKTIGNPLFLQDAIQSIGRLNIFDIGIKDKLFSVVGWGRISSHVMNYQTISCFSWDFICELGLTLFLFPIAIIYLIKHKNTLSLLLFSCAVFTMPAPTVIDFRFNPVELVRLFSFGNSMLILLITCGIGLLYKGFLQKKLLVFAYVFVFCLSPIAQLISGAIFSPHIFSNKPLVELIINGLKDIKSTDDAKVFFNNFNQYLTGSKNKIVTEYKEEINFLKQNSKSLDVAISELPELPAYAGVYSLIPSRRFLYWDLIYSPYNSLYYTASTTLDPYLLDELNIKWLIISKALKNQLPKGFHDILNNKDIFKLAYVSSVEIYHRNSTSSSVSKFPRKIAWVLVNKKGEPAELAILGLQNISLFPTSKQALTHLKKLYNKEPNIKKELITAQPIEISRLEGQLKTK